MSNKISKRVFLLLLSLILVLSFFLRVYHLENRPIHHDESVNGWFIEKIIKEGKHQYSSRHYHGPTFFYLGFFSSEVLGLSLFSIRLVAAVFGFLLCLSPLLVQKELGKIGVLTASLAFTISPAYLFYSRYAIHEILLVCFFSFSALSFYRYLFSGGKHFLFIGGLMLAFAAATKETVIIYLAGVVFGLALALLLARDISEKPLELLKKRFSLLDTILFFIIIIAGMLTWFNWQGLIGFIKSYIFYFDLGTEKAVHEKPWHYFFNLMLRDEWLFVAGGIGGAALALYRRKSFDLFCLGWVFVVFLVHSIIAYKTPWIIINLMLPLIFLLGSFINELLKKLKEPSYKFVLIALLILFTGEISYKGILYSFKLFYEPQNRYSYVHTFASAHDLADRILAILKKNKDIQVAFVSPAEWPYPFLLRGHNQVIYWKRIPEDLKAAVIIARDDQSADLLPGLGKDYSREKYRIRPGLDLELFISKDLLE